jgi:hypothetical protein
VQGCELPSAPIPYCESTAPFPQALLALNPTLNIPLNHHFHTCDTFNWPKMTSTRWNLFMSSTVLLNLNAFVLIIQVCRRILMGLFIYNQIQLDNDAVSYSVKSEDELLLCMSASNWITHRHFFLYRPVDNFQYWYFSRCTFIFYLLNYVFVNVNLQMRYHVNNFISEIWHATILQHLNESQYYCLCRRTHRRLETTNFSLKCVVEL